MSDAKYITIDFIEMLYEKTDKSISLDEFREQWESPENKKAFEDAMVYATQQMLEQMQKNFTPPVPPFIK